MELDRAVTPTTVHTAADILTKVSEIISENLSEQFPFPITVDCSFPDIDSITFITIVVALENEFDFEFDDEMLLLTKFPTIKQMIEYVQSKVEERDKEN